MSALTPIATAKADICLANGHVHFTPESGHVLGYLSDGTLENIFPWHLLCVAIEHMSAYICVITDLTLGVSG